MNTNNAQTHMCAHMGTNTLYTMHTLTHTSMIRINEHTHTHAQLLPSPIGHGRKNGLGASSSSQGIMNFSGPPGCNRLSTSFFVDEKNTYIENPKGSAGFEKPLC